MPFTCPAYEPADAAMRARIARQEKVEAELRAHPDHRYAFEVADAPLEAASGQPVSVLLAVRHGEQVLSGEIHIPRERLDCDAIAALMKSPERQQ